MMLSRITNVSIPKSLNYPYIPVLDGFRGIAIIAVIISHAILDTPASKYFIGKMGVEIFFVLSGFLITTLLLKESINTGSVSFKNFFIRRSLRIIPVAYLFLLVLVLLNYIFKLNISAWSVIASALFVKNLPLNYVGDWCTGHFWTLAVEEQFYIIFPFLLIYNINHYLKVTLLLIIIVPVFQYVGYNNIGLFYSNHILHKSIFLIINLFGNGTTSILIGSLLSVCMFKGLLPDTNNNKYLSLSVLVLAMLFRITFGDLVHSTTVTSTVFSLAIAFVIYICVINKSDVLNSDLNKKIFLKIGVLSYSIYIWQQLFIYQQPWKNAFTYSNSLFLNIPVMLIVSYVSYTFYEKYFLLFKNRFK
jgi:peptidoglycan/LPS O-acetylase OafA/YrhL